MTTSDICGHLLADWVPSLPAAVGSSFIGWPPYLLQVANVSKTDLLAVRAEAARSERQWKSFLSWMLGVAGTRHVLASEGYRWVAPVSAFYPGAVQAVDLSAWHPSFPRSVLSTTRRPRSRCRLCPDYLALRSTASRRTGLGYQWAVAEAKGTRLCLTNTRTCPPAWSTQARNILVTLNGSILTIPRHLVVATRVHPSGANLRTRRLQLRAWNRRNEVEESNLPSEAAVEIAAANLFGLFRGLRLRANANAIAFSVQARTERREQRLRESSRINAARLANLADDELRRRTSKSGIRADGRTATVMSIETELGEIDVELAEPVITIARELLQAEDAGYAAAVLQKADLQLDVWESSRRPTKIEDRKVVLPFGVELRLPQEFEPRR